MVQSANLIRIQFFQYHAWLILPHTSKTSCFFASFFQHHFDGKMNLRILVLIFLAFSFIPESLGNLAAKRYKSTCETNPSEIHLTKGKNKQKYRQHTHTHSRKPEPVLASWKVAYAMRNISTVIRAYAEMFHASHNLS